MQVNRGSGTRLQNHFLSLFFVVLEEVGILPRLRLHVFPRKQLVVAWGDRGKFIVPILIARRALKQVGARPPVWRQQDGGARDGLLVLVANHALHCSAIGGHRDRYVDGSGSCHGQTVGEHVGFTRARGLYVGFSRQSSEFEIVVVRRHVADGQSVGLPQPGAESAPSVGRQEDVESGHVRLVGPFRTTKVGFLCFLRRKSSSRLFHQLVSRGGAGNKKRR